ELNQESRCDYWLDQTAIVRTLHIDDGQEYNEALNPAVIYLRFARLPMDWQFLVWFAIYLACVVDVGRCEATAIALPFRAVAVESPADTYPGARSEMDWQKHLQHCEIFPARATARGAN